MVFSDFLRYLIKQMTCYKACVLQAYLFGSDCIFRCNSQCNLQVLMTYTTLCDMLKRSIWGISFMHSHTGSHSLSFIIFIKFNLIYRYTKWFCPLYRINCVSMHQSQKSLIYHDPPMNYMVCFYTDIHIHRMVLLVLLVLLVGRQQFSVFQVKVRPNRCAKFLNDF